MSADQDSEWTSWIETERLRTPVAPFVALGVGLVLILAVLIVALVTHAGL